MIQVATRFPGEPLGACLWKVFSNELEGTRQRHGKFAARRWGTCPSDFLASPGRLVPLRRRASKPRNPRQRLIYMRFEGASWASMPGCGEADEEKGGGKQERQSRLAAWEGQAPH
jgi:hypothetical protein